ncbi:MAG TPA: hypothetical protein VFV34_23375 [Blastocatellia bacterium]|nr:hypothetical protein [Blastocatellia bacterium]
MTRNTLVLTSVLIFVSIISGCGQQPGPAASKPAEDPKLKSLKDAVAKMTPEEQAVVEKVKGMKPEFNGMPSGRTLAEEVNDYATQKGAFNISVIGWVASRKSAAGREKRWRILLHYQNYTKQFVTAEWEYDPDTNKVYPFDQEQARIFWSAPPADPKAAKRK